MRIAVDAHCLEGNRTGVGRYLSNLLSEWETRSDDEFILYFKDRIPDDFQERKNMRARVLPRPFGKHSTFLFMHIAIPQAIKKDDADLLFCPEYIAPLKVSVPFAVTLHDIVYAARPDLHYWPGAFDRFFLGWVSRQAAHRAKRIFVPSQFTKNEVMRVWNISEEKITVTPEAAEKIFTQASDLRESGNVRARYNLTKPYFLFIGSAFPRRYVVETLDGFELFLQKNNTHQFFIAGTDRYPGRKLHEVARRINTAYPAAVIFADYVASPDLPYVYAGADATVWMSDYEGFGLPPLESLSCGTPVITTKTASLPEVVGECAVFIENPHSPEVICSALQQIVQNTELAASLRACAAKTAARFSWERCAALTAAEFHMIVKS